MPYYHVYIRFLQKRTKSEDEAYELDLSREELKRTIIDPFIKGEEFLVGGCPINAHDVLEISINETGEKSSVLIDYAYRNGLIEDKEDEEDYVIDQGNNVTRKSITQLPRKPRLIKHRRKPEPKDIFIVHGRDHKLVNELKTMLYEFGLNPIILHEQPSGSRTIIEKLEKYSDVGYAFVILTPDDVGGPSKDRRILRFEGKERARQNVVLEFGYFIGLLGRDRVCCLYKKDVELPSDMHGIVYLPLRESVEEVRYKIIKELKAASYELKI